MKRLWHASHYVIDDELDPSLFPIPRVISTDGHAAAIAS
jgi:hypothetical protein